MKPALITLYRALTIIAAAIGTQRCTRARTTGAVERYQRLVPTVSVLAGAERFVVLMAAPFRAGLSARRREPARRGG
jgi:hypothetical protein